MNELALFAGAGGGILAGHLLGWRTICAVERDAYAASILAQRQNDGLLQAFPIWSDVQSFDGEAWRGRVDIVSGGFPCQDISAAGKGAGIDGERSGMWVEMARIIAEVQPRFVLVENSPILTSRGLGRVLGDLAALGMDANWGVLGAHHAGAPHKRDRIWILAWHPNRIDDGGKRSLQDGAHADAFGVCEARSLPDADGLRQPQPQGCRSAKRGWSQHLCESATLPDASSRWGSSDQLRAGRPQLGRDGAPTANANGARLEGHKCKPRTAQVSEPGHRREGTCDAASARLPQGTEEARCRLEEAKQFERPDWWSVEPPLGRLANGVANRVDRLKALGNGQVPAVAALAWKMLGGPIT